MPMEDGFYWYHGSGQEPRDPNEGWVIVKISTYIDFCGYLIKEAYFTGSEICAYPKTELKGKFVGPIGEPDMPYGKKRGKKPPKR